MKVTYKERQIINAVKAGGVIIGGKYPCVAFADGRNVLYFSFGKLCDLQYKGLLRENREKGGDFILTELAISFCS